MNKMWVHLYESGTKEQSKEWITLVSPRPNKSVDKVSGDKHGIFLLEYFKKFFLQDNAHAHKSLIAKQNIIDIGFELIDLRSYSPDLFPKLR